MRKTFGLFVVGGLLAIGAPALAHEAHVHGVAHMNVTVEGKEVEIEWETPLRVRQEIDKEEPGNP